MVKGNGEFVFIRISTGRIKIDLSSDMPAIRKGCKTKEEADELAGPDRIACAKVEWVEGDGIDKGAVAKVRKKRGRPRKEVK